jgi:prepilin-type N-terminal cleavage/methylation domain-containing protein
MINKQGFTLMELIIAMAVGLVIMAAIYSASNMGQRSSVGISQKVVTQQDARAVLDLMAMEIRMASYNPLIKDGSTGNEIWVDKTGAAIAAGNNNKLMKGIQIADNNQIMIEMDLNQNGKILCSEANEVIYYKFDSVNQTISRQTGCGANPGPLTPILGGTGSATMVANKTVNPAVNLFTYWGPDITDAALTDIDITAKVIADPVTWVPQIRRIIITIVANTELKDPTTSKVRTMTYSTSIILRNHVLSPPFPLS